MVAERASIVAKFVFVFRWHGSSSFTTFFAVFEKERNEVSPAGGQVGRKGCLKFAPPHSRGLGEERRK